MALITLTTDYGLQDAYVAGLKAKLYQQLESPQIVDIAHLIDPFHIGQTAYIVRSVYRNFPEKSIHFIGVDFTDTPEQELIVALLNDHYFVCADNGFLSLLEPEIYPSECVRIKLPQPKTFDKAIEAIAHLHRGGALSVLGNSLEKLRVRTQHKPFVNPQQTEIHGHVLHVDRYGNVITNITRKLFDQIRGKRAFVIHARNHSFEQVYNDYHEVIRYDVPKQNREEDGKKLALFNSQGHLELAIYKGNPNYGGGASTLFGLSFLDPIRVAFITAG
ncbi:MAG: Adenosyl-chloride synthase [Bacteroidota bacterium]|nr:MAG: Adenosyl-chloride synthase [Bacteroidota bacterium]